VTCAAAGWIYGASIIDGVPLASLFGDFSKHGATITVAWGAGIAFLILEWLRESIVKDIVGLLQRQYQRTDSRTPRIGWAILAVVCPSDRLDEYAGDLEERFARYVRERGRGLALWWYWIAITKLSLAFIWDGLLRLVKVREILARLGL